jgi:uncharacterized protein YsxB (DUF464 family)
LVKAELVLDSRGLLKSCRVKGHAGAGAKGSDIVCAAVSVLSSTVFKTLSGREGITLRGGAPERGGFWMETEIAADGPIGAFEFLAAAGAFLSEGFVSVSKEFPDFCNVKIERRN